MRKRKVQRCHTCGHIISLREIELYSGMVNALWLVFKWCIEHNRHEFRTRDIKHLFTTNVSARWGDWVMFGGLVYKSQKGHWGLNMQRCDQFFKGIYKIPKHVIKNPVTKQVTQGPDITIHEVKNLTEFLNKDGEFQTKYFPNFYKKVKVLDSEGKVDKIIKLPNL